MGMFQKVGSWLTDQSERFIRGEARPAGSYYGSSEAEQTYGQMGAQQAEPGEEPPDVLEETGRRRAADPFQRSGKDYGGRVPYRSQRDIQAQQAALEAERQRQLRQEQARAHAAPAQGEPGAYGQPQGGYGQPQAAGGYGQPQGGFVPPQPQTGYTPQQPASGYTPQQAQGGYTQQQAPAGFPQQPQGRQPHRPAQAQPDSNVVLFPGMQQGPAGNAYAHVEFVVLLKNRNECTKVIEFIRSNASVFLNMEFIASDTERQRCVDTLTGAAYTLGCQLLKISPRFFYLISPPSVHVVIDPAMQKFSVGTEAYAARPAYEADHGTQRFGGYGAGGYAQAQSQVQRETQSYARPQSYAQPQSFAQAQSQAQRGGQSYGQQGGQTQSYARPQGYAQAQEGFATGQSPGTPGQATARRAPGSFGSVMAGATGSYPGAGSFHSAGAASLQREYP